MSPGASLNCTSAGHSAWRSSDQVAARGRHWLAIAVTNKHRQLARPQCQRRRIASAGQTRGLAPLSGKSAHLARYVREMGQVRALAVWANPQPFRYCRVLNSSLLRQRYFEAALTPQQCSGALTTKERFRPAVIDVETSRPRAKDVGYVFPDVICLRKSRLGRSIERLSRGLLQAFPDTHRPSETCVSSSIKRVRRFR